tara:strand:- start:475 stop:630 length:156 start_codon:yes stop_codon:yes gene_type:complete
MPTIFIILIGIGLIGTGFGFGMLVERLNWNKLIEQGKLPRPGQYRFNTAQD